MTGRTPAGRRPETHPKEPAVILRAYLFLTITSLSWGANAVAGKLAVGHISPMLLTSLRWAMALTILLAFTLPQVRRDIKVIRANLPLLMAYGAVGFTSFNILLYSALQYTTAINVAIEQAGMPMVIFLANFILFRIKVTPAQILGFVLTLAGVAVTASSGSLTRLIGLELNQGDALMLLAVLCYGGYTVALRYKPTLHWQSMITVMAASAFLTSLPFSAFEVARETVTWPDTTGWLVAAFTAIFPSLVAQVLFIKGNEIIGSNRAGIFINLVPIFGTLLSVMILGEMLHLYHVVALGLVLGGIWLSERGKG
uniref:Drug/metabolite transporter (DMT) superfamily permease n=1 Tax=uncultured organism TaxID=155900 RepID=A0A068FP31_9ZZZZ|nr:drug/metabolite transporter (DMT) superfamily permease [uncultured organism]